MPARKKPTAISRDESHRLALRRLLEATVEGALGCHGKPAMTTNEDDPFGRSDRTIIRPNPAGRLTPPLPRAPDDARAPGVQPTPPFLPSPSSVPSPPFSGPPLSQQVGDWDEETRVPRARNLYAGEAAPRGTPAGLAPHGSMELVTLAAHPLMRASASLLLLLGRLRASLARAGPNQLMDQVAHALQQFEVDARAANAPADQIETAKYALAACADDIVQNLPNEDGRV